MLLRVAMQRDDVIVRMDKGSRLAAREVHERSEGKGKERLVEAAD
jgi:hypothetical protein